MSFLDILLIIISSAGLLHGALFAVYLIFFKKKKTVANLMLGLILLFMAFRIGKSVLLNFGEHLEPTFIFIGLSFLLTTGPLLRWYVLAMTSANFKFRSSHILELIPFVLILTLSFFIPKNLFDTQNKQIIIAFGSILIFIYLHFAGYIIAAGRLLQKINKEYRDTVQTKFQKAILAWLKALIWGFVIIWISFFLNIIEDTIPYVIGPIMYSIVVYYLSLKAFQLKTTDIDGNVFDINDNEHMFNKITDLVVKEKLYLEPDLSLARLSKLGRISTQKTSEIINQYAGQNFNDFVNQYRIQDAKTLLRDDVNSRYTIASIAFEVGFSSLSSFNSAFKKFEGMTPSNYRNII